MLKFIAFVAFRFLKFIFPPRKSYTAAHFTTRTLLDERSNARTIEE